MRSKPTACCPVVSRRDRVAVTLSFPVAPMKATLGSLPAVEDGWAYEIKWDGHRTLAHVEADRCRLQTAAGHDSTGRWPELDRARARIGELAGNADCFVSNLKMVLAREGERVPSAFIARQCGYSE